MANVIKVTTHMARASAAILGKDFPLFTSVSRVGEGEFGAVTNYSNTGDTINIRVPSLSTVGTDLSGDISSLNGDVNEGSVPLVLDIRGTTRISLTSKEMTLDANELQTSNFGQQVASVGQSVQDRMFDRLVGKVSNTIHSADTASKDMLNAKAILTRNLAPTAMRSTILETTGSVAVTDQMVNQFTQREGEYTNGFLGKAFGADFYETAATAVVTNGNKVTGVLANAAPTAGSSTLVLKGLTSGDTFKKGQTFTIAGVKAVNPLSGAVYTQDAQFVFTADFTATGATLSTTVYPAFTVGKTVSVLPATSAALTFVGAADEAIAYGFMFHKEAIRIAFAALEPQFSGEGHTVKADGYAVRVQNGSDILSDSNTTRVDILAGIAVVRPEWVVKIAV